MLSACREQAGELDALLRLTRLAGWDAHRTAVTVQARKEAVAQRTKEQQDQAEQNAEPEPAPQPEATAATPTRVMPPDAQPVDTVPGYHYTHIGGTLEGAITVYGPEGTPVATGTDTFLDGTVGTVGTVRLSGGERGSTRRFALLAARQHYVASLPHQQRDRVWIELAENGAVLVHGADPRNPKDVKACRTQGHFYWKPSIGKYGSGSQWLRPTTDRNLAAVLEEFAAQGRAVLVRCAAQADAARVPSAMEQHELEQELQDVQRTISTWNAKDRGGDVPARVAAAYARRALLRAELAHRLLNELSQRPDPALVTDTQALNDERRQLATDHVTYADSDAASAIKERLAQLDAELTHRMLQEIAARPDPAGFTQAQIVEEQAQLTQQRRDFPAGSQGQQVLSQRISALGAAWSGTECQQLAARPAVQDLDDDAFAAEFTLLSARGRQIRELSEDYKAAVQQRRQALRAELERRDEPAHRAALARVTFHHDQLYIDGQSYGSVQFRPGHEDWMATYEPGHGQRRQFMDRSRARAVAAQVSRYDQDPDMEGARTWGPYVSLRVEKAYTTAYVEYAVAHRHSRSSAPREVRHLSDLIRQRRDTQHRAERLYLPCGLLAELERHTHAMVAALRAVHLDRDQDVSDRNRAQRQIKAAAPVLRRLQQLRADTQAQGRDDDRTAISPQHLAQQVAHLNGDQPTKEGEHGPIRATGLGVLAERAPGGTGEAGGSAEVLRGPGDAGADPGGGVDAGHPGDDGTHRRLPPAHRPAPSGAGDGAGADSARRGVRAAAHRAALALPRFVYRDQSDLAPADPVARAHANVEAIALKRRIEDAGQALRVHDRPVLARFSGWGALPQVFARRPRETDPVFGAGGEREGGFEQALEHWMRYAGVRERLGGLLSPTQWRAAASSSVSRTMRWTLFSGCASVRLGAERRFSVAPG
ncbi:hypothetical protein AB0B67_45660, partial [Streptomyces spectabilis]